MADSESSQRRNFTSRRGQEEPNPGGEYVLVGTKMAYRDDKNVLRVHRTGDTVTLDDEQAQRLRAGKPGSPLQTQEWVDRRAETEAILEEVAVANEATLATDDGFQVSPERTRNRRRVATEFPEATDAPATREEAEDRRGETTPAPVTSTATKSKVAK